MEKLNKVLLMMIAMAGIMIAAVGIDRGIQAYDDWKWESERLVRYEQARADVAEMQVTISQLAQDQAALEAFLEENRDLFEEEQTENVMNAEAVEASVSAVDEEDADNGEDVSGNDRMDISGNDYEDVSGNSYGSISGNEYGDISGNIHGSISGNSYGDISGNGQMNTPGSLPGDVSGNTLLAKRKIRGSYMETRMQNLIDRQIISESGIDFSEISIACLGDSITEAANLKDMEDYQQYSYPFRLRELLTAERVTNLGIGGSSIGRYWADAFVDRFTEIPADTDLILIMGGTNDGFCLSEEELGTMEKREANTFIGDLDELMRGLKETYPDAVIVFATPLPNVLHDMLRKERDYLLSQSVLVNVMKQLAAEYGIPVIDLYNSNILDTHDAAVIYNYMPDGVHCNPAGYTVLAEHFAAELIRLYEDRHDAAKRSAEMKG